MKIIGKRFGIGINKILIKKRGDYLPLFLISLIIFFHEELYSNPYSIKLFPNLIDNKKSIDSLSSYSVDVFYDNIFKRSINDTIITNVYRVYQDHGLSLPFNYNSILKINYRLMNNNIGYKDYQLDQQFYSNKKYNIISFGYESINKWLDVDSFYSFSLDNVLKNFEINLTFKYKGFFIQSEYVSILKARSGYFLSDTLEYEFMSHTNYDSRGFILGYIGGRLSFQVKNLSKTPIQNEGYNSNGFRLNFGSRGIQYDSQIIYSYPNYSIWSKLLFSQDSSDVPIIWKDSRIGKFTAIDDTLSSFQIGVDFSSHRISIGTGNWQGKIWISQFSPHIFSPIWAVLSGTKYYLDSRADLEFFGYFYEYKLQNRLWQTNFKLNVLNFKGYMFGEQWAIIFPFITAVNDRLEIKIESIKVIETNFKIVKKLNKNLKINLWSTILVPIDFKIISIPKIKEEPSKNIEGEDISGGMQFGLSFNYLF